MSKELESRLTLAKIKCDELFEMLMYEEDEVMYAKLLGEYNTALDELTMIAGQKAVPTIAKKAISNFKVREEMKIGARVTLRGTRMYEFFDKFVSIALPRVRDFRGVPKKSFDGRGNYAMSVKEQLIFPEISYDQVEKIRGFDICFTTTANTDEEARELLALLGMPFANK